MPKGKIPADVERYVQEHKDQGMGEGKAWAIAWSRFCEYKNPGSDHCRKDSYFEGRKAGADPLRILNTKIHAKSGGDIGLRVTDYDSEKYRYTGNLIYWTTDKPLAGGSMSYSIQSLRESFDIGSRMGSDRSLFRDLVRLAKDHDSLRGELLPLLRAASQTHS